MGFSRTHFLYVVGVIRMSRRKILDSLFQTFEPLVKDAGAELLDVELTSEAGRPILRVTVYKPQGVTLDDCVAVDRILDPLLDEIDPLPGSYNLEVSSPGLERTLKRDKEYEVFRGRLCRVNLYGPVDGKRVYQGALVGLRGPYDEEAVIIDTDKGQIALLRRNISKVQLIYQEKS
ncbi:MAG TPA: ribosome maturation factor RimP [Firmicutes bacterium]|nr:ribosome maturation factor RimP [Bacillota bacterium]